MTANRITFIAILFALLASLTGWLIWQNRTAEEQPPITLNYRLKWLANTGFVGDLYADTYGLFTAQRLQVRVLPGGPEHDAIRELQTGDAQFGVASADQVIQALSKGADVTVVAQLYQRNPVNWIYRTRVGVIRSPADLRGKNIGVTVGDNDETIMHAVLSAAGLQPTDVTLTPVKFDFAPFTVGTVQLFPVYRNTQGVELQRQLAREKTTAAFFDPETADVRFVANSIVTTSRIVAERPDMVRRFVTATCRGWLDAVTPINQDRAVRAVERFVPRGSITDPVDHSATLREQVKVTRDFIIPRTGKVCQIDVAGWQQTESIMLQRGLIPRPVDVREHLRSEFIP